MRGFKNILFIFYLLFDLYFETFFTFCDDLFHVRDFEILFPWKKIVLWMNIFSPWLWWYVQPGGAILRQRVYFPFSLHVWGLSGCPYGSNIKLCSGLSISRSSKYSYHIRPEGGTPVVPDHHLVDASSVCPKEPAWGTQSPLLDEMPPSV